MRRPARSIRNQLVGSLATGVVLLSVGIGVGLYAYMEEVLERGLDAALAARADAIAGTVHVDDDGRPRLRPAEATAAPRHEGPFYYQLWGEDGRTVARFAPPGGPAAAPLPGPSRPGRRFADAVLPDGTVARVVRLAFIAQPDDAAATHRNVPRERLSLVVAHDRRSIDGPLRVLLTGLLLAAAAVLAGLLGIVTWGVRRGLRPLAEVSRLADRIGPATLDVRFPAGDADVPAELRPIGTKLNELLDRLAAAFDRERRFSAAVAHELRTPLAELRSACDVALRWPDDPAATTAALADARDVAVQMSALVGTLLSLARRQAGAEPPARADPVELSPAVAAAAAGLSAAAAGRAVAIDCDVDAAAVVPADPGLLAVVLRNLLENAVTYVPAGGRVRVRATRAAADDGAADDGGGRWSLRVANPCVGLTAAELPKLFEPFWRGDAARTPDGGGRVGLGLSLVQAYCGAMDVAIAAAFAEPELLELTLTFPPPPPADTLGGRSWTVEP